MRKHFLLLALLLMACGTASAQKTHYQGEFQVGYAFGIGDNKIDRLSIHMINGVRFNPYLSTGIGIGIDYYDDHGTSMFSLPLFVNLKGYIPLSKGVSLFASFDLGYSVALKYEEASGKVDYVSYNAKMGMKGLMLTPAIGASFKVAEQNAIHLSVGYDIKTATLDVTALDQKASSTLKCNAIGIKMGFTF